MAGKPVGVHVIGDSDLEVNGGSFALRPGPAIAVNSLDAVAHGVAGGKPFAVYPVTAAQAAAKGIIGGKPMSVVDITSAGRGVSSGHLAIPVYVVSGTLGGGTTPPTPTPPFDPTAYSGLVRWYDFSDTTGMYQDAGQTTPVTANDDPIGSLLDKALSVEAQQTIASRDPVYKTAIQNGKSIGRWADQDEYLIMNTAVDTLGPIYIFVAARKKSSPSVRRQYLFGRSLSSPNSGFGWDTSGNLELGANTAFADMIPAAVDTAMGVEDVWAVYAIVWNGVNRVSAFINGPAGYTSGLQTSFGGWTINEIGAYTTTEFFGDIGEMLIYDGNFDYADFFTVASAFATSWGITWGSSLVISDLHDDFITDETNPLASPRTAEPGGQSEDILDTGGNLSITGGALVVAGGTGSWGQTGIVGPSHTRVNGLAAIGFYQQTANNTAARIGWHDADTGTPDIAITELSAAGSFSAVDGATTTALTQDAYAAATQYYPAVVLRDAGAFHLIKGGTYSNWTLLWPSELDNTATLYPHFQSDDAAGQLHYWKTMRLGDPWQESTGIATDEIEGQVYVNWTFNHEADCILEWVNTTQPTGGDTWEVNFREHTYDTDYYYIATNAAGDLTLNNKTGGGTNVLGTDSAVLSGGEVIRVVCEGVNINVYYDNTLSITYGTAWTNGTFGRVRVLGASARLDDLIAWPRTIRSDNTMYLRRLAYTWRTQDEVPSGTNDSVVQNDLFSHPADMIMMFEVTALPSSGAIRLNFRAQDVDDDCWSLQVFSNGSLALLERVGAGDTSRGSAAAGSVSNGDTVGIECIDNVIRVKVNGTQQFAYRSADTYKTATDGKWKVIANGADVDNIQIWPYTITTDMAYNWLETYAA